MTVKKSYKKAVYKFRRKHRRTADVLFCQHGHPWWDWGHRVMALTGSDFGGNWDCPKPSTWFYTRTASKPRRWTGYPRSKALVIKDWETMRAMTAGLDEDGMYEWQAVGMDQDGDVILGRRYWGGDFHSLDYWEAPVVLRWLIMWRLNDLFGFRSWLYSCGLKAVVYRRKPFACHQAPAKGSNGYDHWLCTERRRHKGPHRMGNYTWSDGDRLMQFKETA